MPCAQCEKWKRLCEEGVRIADDALRLAKGNGGGAAFFLCFAVIGWGLLLAKTMGWFS